MEDVPTCGRGLAAHAPLPAKLGEFTESVAAVLENHTRALDLTDEHAQTEHGVYLDLVSDHRQIAGHLQALGKKMAGYRDLPMGRHDVAALASPETVSVFERFVRVEEELLALLQARVEQDRQMLVAMGGAAGGDG